MIRRLRSDAGLSLTELLMVMALMGIILGGAWGGYFVVSGGQRTADRESMMARELAYPLLQSERLLIQQVKILDGWQPLLGKTVNPGEYLIAFTTDQDSDGHIETHYIEATAAGKLVIATTEQSEHALELITWSDVNRNREQGVPLFRYYNTDGAEITDPGQIADKAHSIRITAVVTSGDQTISDSRHVTFRN